MKQKLASRKIAAVGGAVCLALSVLASPVTSMPVQAAAPGDEVVSPQQDLVIWIFKDENGSRYRRLYNVTHNRWVTDYWEYIGPTP